MRLFLIQLPVIIFLTLCLTACEGLNYLVHGDQTEESKDECKEWKSSDDDEQDCVDWNAAKFRSQAQKAMDAGQLRNMRPRLHGETSLQDLELWPRSRQ